ncbi:MAG TPA: translocation/assembly module TamB domain-containing protein, partial [Terriglobia bacterium]|nr:translocation/assembly module TamB domain-containing protein [Terriglobia bacterium]
NLKLDYQVSVDNLRIIGGEATINDQSIPIDLAISKLNAGMTYRGKTGVLSGQARYDGTLQSEAGATIPYSLDVNLDLVAGTIVAHGIDLKSGESALKAQGRIDHALTANPDGRLEYSGVADARFLDHFLRGERLAGRANVIGRLEFGSGSLATSGELTAARIDAGDWNVTALKTNYEYRLPEKQLTLNALSATTAGGTAEGAIKIADLPGLSRVTLDLKFHDVDTVALERLYPWDHRYRVYSRVDGAISGWLEGRFDRYQLSGSARLTAYTPAPLPDVIALPLDGEGGFTIRPGRITVNAGRAHFFATAVEADGVIEPAALNLKTRMTSTDLRNFFFIHRDANGSGTFEGTLTGSPEKPTAAGKFTAAGVKYRAWTIERAEGGVLLDTGTETADLNDVQIFEGSSSITVRGHLALNGESADLRLETPHIEAKDAARFDPRIAGRVDGIFSGVARITSLSPLRVEGDIEARDLTLEQHPISAARAHVRFVEPLVELSNLSVTRGGASITGTASYNTQSSAAKFDVAARSIDLDSIREFGVPAGLRGTVDCGRCSGEIDSNPLSFKGKNVVLQEHGGARISGDLDYSSNSLAFELDVASTPLALARDVIRELGKDPGLPASAANLIVESGHFSGAGATGQPVVKARNLKILDSRGARLDGDVSYDATSDALQFDVKVTELKLSIVRDMARDLGLDPAIPAAVADGTVIESGRFIGTGAIRRPVITGKNVRIHESRGASLTGDLAYNSTTDELRFEMNVAALDLGIIHDLRPEFNAPRELLNGTVIERGRLTGSGSLSRPVIMGRDVTIHESHGATLTGSLGYDVAADKATFDLSVASLGLSALRDLGVPESLNGTIERARMAGTVIHGQPDMEGSARLRNVTFFGEEFPTADLTVSRSNGPAIPVRFDASSISFNAEIDIRAPGYPFVGSGSFTRYPVERLARLQGETLRLTGKADRLEGSLTDPTQFRGSGKIESAEMLVGGRALTSTGPFSFEFTHDRATFSGMSLTGGGTQLNVEGTVSLTEKETLDLKVSGTVPLELITANTDWPATGTLDLNGRVGGTIQDRDLFGIATFKNVTVAPKGFFASITGVTGGLFFNGNNVRLDEVTGAVGGGKVQIQGEATLGQNQIESMNIRVGAENVRVLYPEGLRTVADGVLLLRGNWDNPLLEGNVQIQNMSYQSQFENFLSLLQAPGGTGNTSPLSRLNLSIHVEGNRNISIKNELTEAQARVSLDIRGTVGAPALTGHVEARGGTLLFQGRQYEITRGNIDFVNPFVVEPVVDVQAEADFRNYRVILGITGRGDKLRFEMRSDPPLPDLEVFSLIAGGRTREELVESGTQNSGVKTSEQLFPGAAAAVLVDLLKSRVGESLGLLRLDQFRIDPLPLGSDKNALARITVPIQVSKDLSITYSQDLSSNAQQIIQIEYFLSKNLSIIATRDENGALGLDIKRRQRF